MKDIKIMVAMHKPYKVAPDDIYYPVHVGASGKESFAAESSQKITPDDGGENISSKNPNYCELTGLYYMWKNVPADYLGLCHYRRYFAKGKAKDKWAAVAGRKEIENALKEADVLLPVKRNYFIETNYGQYVHAHHEEDLKLCRRILKHKYPEFLPAYDSYMKRTSGHRFNMFIMKRSIADEYCEWLFDILNEMEKRLDISAYSANDARVFGFVSERLIDPWIETKGIAYKEMPVVFMEDVNWIKKGGEFLRRKFVGKR